MKAISVYRALAISNSRPENTLYVNRQVRKDPLERIKRDDWDEAMICLTCTKKKCTGERGCFEARKRQLAKEARS